MEAPFRIALGASLLATFVVRIYGHRQTLQAGKIRWIEGKANITLRIIAGLAGVTTLWTYLIWPEGILWASVPVPDWIRWLGTAAGAIGVAMLAWVHRALGRNFAASLHLRTEGHRLVTSGPYRWVRNPMYTSIYIILVSFFLVSANCLIGLAWLTGYSVLLISRLPKEEALMEETFGDEYNTWAAHTGRYLPRIRRKKAGASSKMRQSHSRGSITIRFASGQYQKLKADSAKVEDGVLILYAHAKDRSKLQPTHIYPIETVQSAQLSDGTTIYGDHPMSMQCEQHGSHLHGGLSVHR